MPRYLPIDGEKVSAEWLVVLRGMRDDGVVFQVNEGHRTMARQRELYNLYRSGRGNLAAFPSPFAPHIRTGRIDHAIDFSNDGAVFNWLERKGLRPARTVRGESWHIEVSAGALRAYRPHDPLKALSPRGREVAEKLLYHRREMRRLRHGATPRARRVYAKHLRWARFYKARLTAALPGARGAKRAAIRQILKAKTGEL